MYLSILICYDNILIGEIVRELEAVNPTKEPLKSDLLNGKWELMYTTSRSILQSQVAIFLQSLICYLNAIYLFITVPKPEAKIFTAKWEDLSGHQCRHFKSTKHGNMALL